MCPQAPECTGHAMPCPKRHGGGLKEVDVKSAAGRRSFVIPDQLWELILKHEQVQQKEREIAGTEWHEGGWMFTQPNGKPIDARRDWEEWKSILREAGVRDARLHDARHTAATVLLLLGVNERVVMAMMGWSSTSMRKRYQHITEQLRRDVADQLNGYFWKSAGPAEGNLSPELRAELDALTARMPAALSQRIGRLLDEFEQGGSEATEDD
jgi:hypothetical protein